MSTLDQKRRERARNGSRRQRDIDALQPERVDWDAYLTEHFPDELYGHVLWAAQYVYLRDPKRDRHIPDPADVRVLLERRGWLREQLESLEEHPPCP
jgi:hypothetical protein